MKAKRISPGSYEYRGWIINRMEKLQGDWVAYREDDPSWVLDPIPTLRETKETINYNPNPAESARLRTLWAKLDAESGYAR